MQRLARSLVVAALAALVIVPALAVRAEAKILAVRPVSPIPSVLDAAARAEGGETATRSKRRFGRLRWIYRHMDGGGSLRPLAPVDNSSGRPESLGSSWAVRFKIPF